MKKSITKTILLFAGLSIFSFANATKHIVTVQNFSFSPATISASVGDTIEWQWVSGTHTTTSTTIPGGAASWSANMNGSNTTFQYKITTAGTYNYQCNFHFNMGMVGVINVTATGTPAITNSQPIAKIFPNPTTSIVNIHLNISPNTNVLIVTDIQGKEVVRETLTNTDNTLDVSTWQKGVYFYQLMDGTETMKGKLEVQ